MEVNITLLFQAMQFACAYFFLYHFLFTPAYKILEENELLEKKIYEDLESQKHIKNALQQDFDLRLKSSKKNLVEAIPVEAVQLGYQKSEFSSTLCQVEKVQFVEQDIKNIEHFLVDHLSRVVKK